MSNKVPTETDRLNDTEIERTIIKSLVRSRLELTALELNNLGVDFNSVKRETIYELGFSDGFGAALERILKFGE